MLLLSLTLSLSLSSDDFFAVKDKIINESRFKFTFLYFTPLLLLENVGYTSSIYTYDAREIPDWTGDLGLGLRASAILANRFVLQAEDLPSYSFYLENNNLRAWSNRFAANAYSFAGPLNLKAGYARNDLNQRPNLEFSRPYRYTDSEWSGEVDIGRAADLFLTVYAAFRELAYDEDPYLESYNLAESLNHRENVFGLRLNKLVFTRTVIFLNYESNDYVFAQRSERDAKAQKLALGIEFPEIGVLQGSVQIGLKRFVPENPFFQAVQRASGRGDLQVTLAERLRFSGFYELDTRFSYNASDLFYDTRTIGGGAEIYFARFLKGGASYDDSRLRYHSFLDLALQRSDRIRLQRYFLAIPFIGSTALGVAYNVYRLNSAVLGLDYTRSFWGGFINHEF
ncbi:MAG: hypothetical protein ABII93_09050 [Chrysiogenia bacterium]